MSTPPTAAVPLPSSLAAPSRSAPSTSAAPTPALPAITPQLARLDAGAELLLLEQLVSRREAGVRAGEWSCARFESKPTGDAKKQFMRDMLADVTATLERTSGEPAFLAYGTLLGALRGHDVMEWTGDLDLALSKRATDSLGEPAMQQALFERGYAAFLAPRVHEHPGGIWRICATPSNHAARALGPAGTWGEAAQPNAPTAPLSWEATWQQMDATPYVDIYGFGDAAATVPAGAKRAGAKPAAAAPDAADGAADAPTEAAGSTIDHAIASLGLAAPRFEREREERKREAAPLDLEGWTREGDGSSLWREHGLRRGHLFPPRRIEMNGHAFSVPRKAEWLLDVHYGDWHTVRKCSHAAGGDCPEAAPPAVQPLLPTQLDLDPTQPQGLPATSSGGEPPPSQELLVEPAPEGAEEPSEQQPDKPPRKEESRSHPAQREKQAQQLEHQAPPHAAAMEPRSGGQRPPQLAAPARGPVGKLPGWGWQQPVPWMMQAAAPSWW